MSSEENIVEFEVNDGAKTAGGMDAAGEADVTDSSRNRRMWNRRQSQSQRVRR